MHLTWEGPVYCEPEVGIFPHVGTWLARETWLVARCEKLAVAKLNWSLWYATEAKQRLRWFGPRGILLKMKRGRCWVSGPDFMIEFPFEELYHVVKGKQKILSLFPSFTLLICVNSRNVAGLKIRPDSKCCHVDCSCEAALPPLLFQWRRANPTSLTLSLVHFYNRPHMLPYSQIQQY